MTQQFTDWEQFTNDEMQLVLPAKGRKPIRKTTHLTFTPLNLTRKPPHLTQNRLNLTLTYVRETARRLYNITLFLIQSYVSYVSLAGGVRACAHTRAHQPIPPSLEKRVRCVRSGFRSQPSCDSHLTFRRKSGVRGGVILRKMMGGYKWGRIIGGVR